MNQTRRDNVKHSERIDDERKLKEKRNRNLRKTKKMERKGEVE